MKAQSVNSLNWIRHFWFDLSPYCLNEILEQFFKEFNHIQRLTIGATSASRRRR